MSGRRQRMAAKPWGPESLRRRVERIVAGAAPRVRPVLREFAHWLEAERGLTLGSVAVRIHSVKSFAEALARRGSVLAGLATMTALEIETRFVRLCHDRGSAWRRSFQAALRLFLEFAGTEGWLGVALVRSVPSLRGCRLSTVPRALPDADVARLVASVQGRACCARDRAIVLMLVVYGVRRGQIGALQLADIDWRRRTIRFHAQKGGKVIVHELTPELAAAIADYVRGERPESTAPEVFLRKHAPYTRLSPMAITEVVAKRLQRLGVRGTPTGPHALRHAFATRLLRAGKSLKEIADLLGHRSLSSTSLYTKVDHARLVQVAGEWPEVRR
jgi:integrase/recombinase XerD